jgi:Pectate lyase superfamily protein
MSNTFARDPEPLVQYGGDGSRTTFPFPFPVLAADDLLVYVGQNPATGFAITGIGDPDGGEIVFNTPPAPGTTITLLRGTEGIRETEFVDGGSFRASAINAEFDRIMLLIQEDREEHGRALRGHPAESGIDFCLPATIERANRLLGFDSAGKPAVFGATELPSSGDASGVLVTPNGATTARSLGEHTAALVNVRDFGALGDAVTDDSAAFAAAITAAQGRAARVYVPASATPYVLGATLVLDGVTMIGDGAGSTLRVGLPSGAGLQLAGSGAGLIGLRVLGSGAAAWPASPLDVDLSAVALDGVRIASGADDAALQGVEVAACATALAIEGGVRAIVGCAFGHSVRGVEIRTGAAGAIFVTRTRLHACTAGIRSDGAAVFDQLALRGGRVVACGRGLDLVAPGTAWRTVELSDLEFAQNLEADLEAGPRQSLALRGGRLDPSGKRNGAAIELNAAGQTALAPNLVVENTYAPSTEVVSVQLSDGTNLNLLAPGDLIVLAADADDVDDLWTALKATRGGVVHKVNAQTASTATIELASAATLPVPVAADVIRVFGRSGTAGVASVGAPAPSGTFTWLRADDHCRVFAANNPMPADQIELEGPDADLRHFPGQAGEPVAISGVDLQRGAVNGALTRLVTFEIAQNAAINFVPPSPIGLLHVFSHGSLGDPAAAVLSYRADAVGYTQIVAKSTYAVPGVNPAMSDVEVEQLTALTGTTGSDNVFTFSAHTDGKIYVENRKVGSRTVSLFVIGAPL